jgi:hypothetical protein
MVKLKDELFANIDEKMREGEQFKSFGVTVSQKDCTD